jgi:hypothetical protein
MQRRDIHVYGWDDEPADERPSEFMLSTGFGTLYNTQRDTLQSTQSGALYSTQHDALYSTQHGGQYSTHHGALDSVAESRFTRPSPLPREHVKLKRRFRDLPVPVVTAILGGAAWLVYEFARLFQR